GEKWRRWSGGLCAAFKASPCSPPPLPIRSTFTLSMLLLWPKGRACIADALWIPMADRIAQTATNLVEYTVSELAFALRRTVEDNFGLVKLRGEISGFKGRHASGHCYFPLKDEHACIEAVIWKSPFQRLKFKPEQGLEVIARGRVTPYPDKSKYQIVIDELEPAGVGALMALLEQ